MNGKGLVFWLYKYLSQCGWVRRHWAEHGAALAWSLWRTSGKRTTDYITQEALGLHTGVVRLFRVFLFMF